jgi:hypothetical protein
MAVHLVVESLPAWTAVGLDDAEPRFRAMELA